MRIHHPAAKQPKAGYVQSPPSFENVRLGEPDIHLAGLVVQRQASASS
jgi:hypothetical protein